MSVKSGNRNLQYVSKRLKLAALALAMGGALFATRPYVRAQEAAQGGTPQGAEGAIDLGTELSPTEYLRIEEGAPINVGSEGPRRDPAKELPMKITAPFTIAAVGDIIEPDPISERADPGFQSLIKVIRDADVGFANMESNLVDIHHRDEFLGPISGTVAPKEIGADIRAMGITMMNRANNHSMDGGEAGILSTNAILREYGIVPAGTGANLDEARAASFRDTPKGRVGLGGMFSMDSGTSDIGPGCCDMGADFLRTAATYRVGDLGGKTGVNPLRLTTYHIVTPEQLQMLRTFRNSYFGPAAETVMNGPTDQMKLFDEWYRVGTPAGSLSYTMNPGDEREILQSIRNGKVHSDFMIATIHAHQGIQNIGGLRTVSDFLIKLAHECIDNGADIFLTHGPHMLEGVEIYKGKPIFYGLASFVFQTDLQILGVPPGDMLTKGRTIYARPINAEGVVAASHYEGGQLTEVRLYPVDLGGYPRPGSSTGIPTAPTPERARQILEELQALSKPFGTTINIENNVGVIHVAAAGSDKK